MPCSLTQRRERPADPKQDLPVYLHNLLKDAPDWRGIPAGQSIVNGFTKPDERNVVEPGFVQASSSGECEQVGMMKGCRSAFCRIIDGQDEDDLAKHLLEHIGKGLDGQDDESYRGFVEASTPFPIRSALYQEARLFGRNLGPGLPEQVSSHKPAESPENPVIDKGDRNQSRGSSQETVEDNEVKVSLGWKL
jgi:hypothetical protein